MQFVSQPEDSIGCNNRQHNNDYRQQPDAMFYMHRFHSPFTSASRRNVVVRDRARFVLLW